MSKGGINFNYIHIYLMIHFVYSKILVQNIVNIFKVIKEVFYILICVRGFLFLSFVFSTMF